MQNIPPPYAKHLEFRAVINTDDRVDWKHIFLYCEKQEPKPIFCELPNELRSRVFNSGTAGASGVAYTAGTSLASGTAA